jgi:hypothetical protein
MQAGTYQRLAAHVAVPRRLELLAEVVDGALLLVEPERGPVLEDTMEGTGLRRHALDKHAWHWLALVGVGWRWLALIGVDWRWLAFPIPT